MGEAKIFKKKAAHKYTTLRGGEGRFPRQIIFCEYCGRVAFDTIFSASERLFARKEARRPCPLSGVTQVRARVVKT